MFYFRIRNKTTCGVLSASRRILALPVAALAIGLAPSADAAFTINLSFTNLTSSQQSIFNSAKATWESLISGYAPGITRTGISIAASGVAIDGVNGVLGQAGPNGTTVQGGFRLTTTGVMQFDTADMASLEASNQLDEVVLHEMAHVMGFGTLWTANNVYTNGTGNYRGAFGVAAYRQEYSQATATSVPVDITSGGGTANAHWRELTSVRDPLGRTLSQELMTGFLSSNAYISNTTLQSFRDIGFTPVPEPASITLMAAGLSGMAMKRRKAAKARRSPQ